jgi:peptidoglycan/LPS O-acetylase OafA/YrhL
MPTDEAKTRGRAFSALAFFADWLFSRSYFQATITAGARNAHPAYRSDIDGLRALAILAVLGYHAFPEWVPGGFVGVDIFFVISGFLISTIIFKGLAAGKFSFIEFYVRRIRRIFPALIAMIVFCLFVGWCVLLPSEFEYLGKHIAASAAFLQNFNLSGESGYFDISSDLKPLNHLWSLAIEEQFYAIFPPLMWGMWQLGFSPLIVVATICGVSLATDIFIVPHSETTAFFSLGTRAWELMAGSLLAAATIGANLENTNQSRLLSRISIPQLALSRPQKELALSLASIIGLGLIVFAVADFNRATPYPGAPTVIPIAGSFLLIFSGSQAWVNRFVLSNRSAVFVGLISYPLYLWHWPLLSYLTIVDNAEPEPYERVSALALSVVLAWLTYEFIEKPIRQQKKVREAAPAFLIAAMILLITAGLNAKSFYRDYGPETNKILQSWDFKGYSGIDGMYTDGKYGYPAIGHNDKNRVMFFGDSHAEQYELAVARRLAARAAGSADPAEVMFPPKTFPAEISGVIREDPTITTVIFSYFWSLSYGDDKVNRAIRCCGNGLNQIIGGKRHLVSSLQRMDDLDKRWEGIARSLRTVGKQVYFVLDNPFGEEIAPRSMISRSFFRRIEIAIKPFATNTAIQRDEPVRSRLIKIAHDTNSGIIDPIAYLCNQDICPALAPDGMPIYKDYDHLSEDTVVNRVHYLDAALTTPMNKSE